MPAKKTPKSKLKVPSPTNVQMPPDYVPKGTKSKFLTWQWATERLERSHNYWICSTRPDGRPHAVPVWGVWVENAFYFSTDPKSRKAKNLKVNPAISVHLESGDEATILEGTIATTKLTTAVDNAYNKKYKMRLSSFNMPYALYRLAPSKVLSWREKDFVTSATKWVFE